jgi:hypothetical protein
VGLSDHYRNALLALLRGIIAGNAPMPGAGPSMPSNYPVMPPIHGYPIPAIPTSSYSLNPDLEMPDLFGEIGADGYWRGAPRWPGGGAAPFGGDYLMPLAAADQDSTSLPGSFIWPQLFAGNGR